MKKFISVILLLAMVLTLGAGCASKTTSSDTAVPVIGIIQYGEHPSLDNCRTGFIQGLTDAGLTEGTDFTIDYQNAGFDDGTDTQIAQNFAANKVSMICAIATPSAVAAYAATEGTDIPVIFCAITDPVAAKLDSGNITGTSDKLPIDAQLELIRALQPDAKTIGILYTTSEANSVSAIAEYQAKAANYGFTIEALGVSLQSEVTLAADTLIAKKVNCFCNLTDNNVVGVLSSVLEKTNEAKIPVYGSEIEQVKIGCVASAGIDYVELGKKTGAIAAKVLKGETTADKIPFETITDYNYYVNSAALTAMGITLPTEIADKSVETSAE